MMVHALEVLIVGELEDFMRTQRAHAQREAEEHRQRHLEREVQARSYATEFVNFMLQNSVDTTALYVQQHTITKRPGTLFRKPHVRSGYQHTFRGMGWPIPTDPEYPERRLIVLTSAEAYNCEVPTMPKTRPDDIHHEVYAVMSEYELNEQTYRFALESGKLLLASAMIRIEQGGQL